MAQAVAVTRLETDAVRVTEWQFQPGDETGHHRHGFEYVIVPLTGGTLRLVEPGGERLAPLAAGVAYSRPAGVEHNVINAGDQYLAFVEVELKHRPG